MDTPRPCRVGNGQHFWIKVEHEPDYKGMQCYSCPTCFRLIHWSNILEQWIDCTRKRNLRVEQLVKEEETDE